MVPLCHFEKVNILKNSQQKKKKTQKCPNKNVQHLEFPNFRKISKTSILQSLSSIRLATKSS